MLNGITAIVLGYLLGAIPSAYIITRLLTGKDIRQLGGGNAGARNTFLEVGRAAGFAVGIFDTAKGALAVFVAGLLVGPAEPWSLSAPWLYILAAGSAAVIGHIWPVYIKFSGGNGLATSIGVIAFLMSRELLIAVALIVVLFIITRNIILSANAGLLLAVPVSGWFFERSWVAVVYPLLLGVIMVINFFPTARKHVATVGNTNRLMSDLVRTGKPEEEKEDKRPETR